MESLEALLTTHSKALSLPCNTTLELNDKVDLLSSILHKAAKLSSTAHHISHNSHNRKLRSPWWNRTLRTLRKATPPLERRGTDIDIRSHHQTTTHTVKRKTNTLSVSENRNNRSGKSFALTSLPPNSRPEF